MKQEKVPLPAVSWVFHTPSSTIVFPQCSDRPLVDFQHFQASHSSFCGVVAVRHIFPGFSYLDPMHSGLFAVWTVSMGSSILPHFLSFFMSPEGWGIYEYNGPFPV